MADKEKPYKLPMVGKPPKKRLSRAEFEELVRTMGARAARDYMRDEGLIRPSRSLYPEGHIGRLDTARSLLRTNLSDEAPAKNKDVYGRAAETVARATGMKNGGVVKASKVAKFKNGGCVMAGRGVRNTKVL
jgi:hypothetical protein